MRENKAEWPGFDQLRSIEGTNVGRSWGGGFYG